METFVTNKSDVIQMLTIVATGLKSGKVSCPIRSREAGLPQRPPSMEGIGGLKLRGGLQIKSETSNRFSFFLESFLTGLRNRNCITVIQ